MEIKVQIKNTGGSADEHQIRLIDAADMYSGIDRSISYILLSVEHGSPIAIAHHDSAIKVFQRKTRDNCIIHDIIVSIPEGVTWAAVFGGVAGNLATDVLKGLWRAAVGALSSEDEAQLLQRHQRIEPYFDELVEKIEPHIAKVHAPIRNTEKIEILFGNEQPFVFDRESKEFVSTKKKDRRPIEISGHVTRLNLVTGNGRFFDQAEDRIIPFSQTAKFRKSRRSKNLSWSLRREDREQNADLTLKVKALRTASGRIKRYLIENATRSVSTRARR